jgi:hypothetical protein
MHNRAEDDRRDEDANCLYEGIPQRLHFGAERRIKAAQCNAHDHCDEHLEPQLKVPRLSFLALNGGRRGVHWHRFLPWRNALGAWPDGHVRALVTAQPKSGTTFATMAMFRRACSIRQPDANPPDLSTFSKAEDVCCTAARDGSHAQFVQAGDAIKLTLRATVRAGYCGGSAYQRVSGRRFS